MSGRKGRSGRKPLPVSLHLARGTFRPDRHGPRPATVAPPVVPPPSDVDVETVAAGLGKAGRALVEQHLAGMDDWSPRDLALLRQAGLALDRQTALQRAIDAEGLVLGGKPHPALRAERQAGAAVVTALRALDVTAAPAAVDAGRRRA